MSESEWITQLKSGIGLDDFVLESELREQIAQEIEAKCAKKTWRITFDAFPGEMELFGCPQDVYDNDTMLVCTHYEDAAIARGTV